MVRLPWMRRRPLKFAGWLTGAAAVAAALFFLTPEMIARAYRCPVYALSGFLCPCCGVTRAAHALLHGRWGEAFGYNPAFVVLGPMLFLLVLNRRRRGDMRFWIVWLVLALSWGIVRNL